MTRIRTRLIVGALALALPLAAAAGCGVEKRRTIKAELASAGDYLQASKALSVTLRIKDDASNLEKILDADGSTPKAVTTALLGGSVSITLDPAGQKTLAQLQTAGKSDSDLKTSLKRVNLSLAVRDDKTLIGELRLVEGTLYAHVDIAEINRLAVLGGSDPVDDSLDQTFGDDPKTAKALADVRAGKWLKLPITDYIDKFKELAQSFGGGETTSPEPAPSATPDYQALGDRVFNAVKPFVKVTDANDNSADRVLDVNVQVRPALKAALAVLKATKDLPFASALTSVDAAEIDKNIADGTAHGTITLSNSHLQQVSVDLESVRTLNPDAGAKTLKGAVVVLDVDDSAAQVTAPTNVSSFDIGEMLDGFLSDLQDQQAA